MSKARINPPVGDHFPIKEENWMGIPDEPNCAVARLLEPMKEADDASSARLTSSAL